MKALALTVLLASLFRPDIGTPPITLTCDAGGAATTTLPNGTYEVLVAGGTAYLCYESTCPTGGEARVPGNHGLTLISKPTPVSCRSDTGATIQWVPGRRL